MNAKRLNIPISDEELALVEEIKAALKPTLGPLTTAGAVRWALRAALREAPKSTAAA